jgi:hypothetical protein
MFDFKRIFDLRIGLLPVLLVAFMSGCGGGGGLDPILGTPPAGALPRVIATTPVASSPVVTGVALNSVVSAAFSKDMAPETLSGSSFTLNCPGGTAVRAAVTYNPATRVATLTPEAALPPAALCVATITTAVKDTVGLALASNFVWSFMTAPDLDLTPPTVVMTTPAAAAADVLTNTTVTAVFSEDMLAASLNSTSFTLVNTTLGTPVPGTVSYSATGRSAVFTPAAPGTLAPGSQFRATITTGAADLAGNTLAANYVWTFTTAALADTTRPTVVQTAPAPGATAVASNTAITATFSEDMNPASISATSFTLVNSTLNTAVSGTVSYSPTGRTAVFTPSTPAVLAPNSAYTATITTEAADLAGNTLAANFVWTFTTAATGDITAPSVITIFPAGNAVVATNTAIRAGFSEDMNPNTISGRSFTLVNTTLGTPVAGTVSYSAIDRSVIFTPSNPAGLPANSSFRVTITPIATDLAGNGLEGDFVWAFTTAALANATRPTVVEAVPLR